MNRRHFMLSGAAAILAGCSDATISETPQIGLGEASGFAAMYGPINDEQFPVAGIRPDQLPPQFRRQIVAYSSPYPVGTVIVDTEQRYLFHVMEGGQALRYGVGIGRQGFGWEGEAVMQWKKAWPKWTPPDEMIARQPELEKWSARNGGMPPGIENPLGARALYLFEGGRDTLYRLHGTTEVRSIGKAVSSGCVRLVNQDVIHLYNRVQNGSRVIVRQPGSVSLV